jgi:hypothetical protein
VPAKGFHPVFRICLVLGVAGLFLSGCGGLSSGELRRQIDVVASTTAEGKLLASQVAANDIRDSFTRVQAGVLGGEMDHTVAKLQEAQEEGSVSDELHQANQRTIQLASDASDALQELELNPADTAKAAETATKLGETNQAAKQLSDEL